MALTATIYRFQIELSNISEAIYETLDFRVAQHPSEHLPYLLTRVLAFALNTQEGLEFSTTGLSDPDAAAISLTDSYGGFKLLIEIGSPSAKKLHKATKASKAVKVYIYKNPEHYMAELSGEKIHRAEEIEFYSFPSTFIEELSQVIKKDNRWSLIVDDGVLTVQAGENTISSELGIHRPL